MKKITVILPLYELSSDVGRAILSIKQQSISDEVELKILDLRNFCTPRSFGKKKKGNLPDYVKTDKKLAKSKDIDNYIGTLDFPFKIIKADNEFPYLSLNTLLQSASGEYIIFLAQNCIFTKDILEKLYISATEKSADVLIGNSIKQCGKKLNVTQITKDIYGNDENINFKNELSILFKDNSLYNKLFKTKTIQIVNAEFSKLNAPKNMGFLTSVYVNSNNICIIDNEIYLRDFKPLYEYEYIQDLQYNLEYADSLLRIIEVTSSIDNNKYIDRLISIYIEPLFNKAQKSVNSQLRKKCVEIYNALNKAYPKNDSVQKLVSKYPIAKQQNYNKINVILSRVKHKIVS